MKKCLLAILALVITLGAGAPLLRADDGRTMTSATMTSATMTNTTATGTAVETSTVIATMTAIEIEITIGAGSGATDTNTAFTGTATNVRLGGIVEEKPAGETADCLRGKLRSTVAESTSIRGVRTIITRMKMGAS